MSSVEAKVEWPGRLEASLKLELDEAGTIKTAKLQGIGGPKFLELLKAWRPKLTGALKALAMPEGRTPEAIGLRELLQKAKGEWNYPFQEEELCHCRAVPTATVDQAICAGAHTPRKVSEWTSASTACGTCRPDVEAILAHRLKTS